MALNVKTLATRALTALVFVIVFMYCLRANYYTFLGFFFLISMLGLKEFYALAKKFDSKPYQWIGYVCGALLFLSQVNFRFLGDLKKSI